MSDKKNKKPKSVKEDDPRNQEIKKLQQDLNEMTEMAKRTMADLQNLKRRQEEERGQVIKMANASLIKELLPVLDNLNRAKQHTPDEAKDWCEGVVMSINNLDKIFTEFGLTEIPTTGEAFNPDLHEALMQGPGDKDIILEELEKGFCLGDFVIRHAKVKVGNGEKE